MAERDDGDDAPFIWAGDKNLKKLQRAAYDAGWRPRRKKAGVMWRAPDGLQQIMVHGSANGARSFENVRAKFREHGLDV